GEYVALAASLEYLGEKFDNGGALVLGETLEAATASYLKNARSPSRKVHELDNRGSTFYLTLYWARALADQTSDAALARRFEPVARALEENEATILSELNGAQGPPQDIGGYYMVDEELAEAALRPSATLNGTIQGL
ncbi:MAG: NADP-dependent isocitrate dehydrogenase, partial [Longimicrobiales bacterium]